MDRLTEILKRMDPDELINEFDNNGIQNRAELKLANSGLETKGIKKLPGEAKIKTSFEGMPKTSDVTKPAFKDVAGEIVDKGMGALELGVKAFNDLSGNSYNTSPYAPKIKSDKLSDIGANAMTGAATGFSVGGPVGAIVGGLAMPAISMIGKRKAQQEQFEKKHKLDKKKSELERRAIDEEYKIKEGETLLADLAAIRKKQLGYV